MSRFLTTIFTAVALTLATPLCVNSTVSAASIIATVNNKVITDTDLQNRIKFTLLSMNLPVTKANKDKVRAQVLDTLIQEQIKLQLGEEFGIKADPSAVEASIRRIEQQNNMPEGGFKKMLQKNGIPFAVMKSNLKASMIWNDYIRARFGDAMQVSDKDVEKALMEKKAAIDETRYHLAEIVLPITAANSLTTQKARMQDIVGQLKKGAQFSMLASQVSGSASATRGGDIDWIPESKLDDAALLAVKGKKEGDISDIAVIKTGSSKAVKVFLIRDKLKAGQTSKPKTVVTFKQVFVADPKDAFAFEIEGNLKQVEALSKQISSCKSVERLVKSKNGTVQFAKDVPVQNLPTPVKDVLLPTAVGKASKVVYTGNGALFFVMCSKNTTSAQDVTKDMVKGMLLDAKLQNISEQELQNRMASAHIDRRTSANG